MKTKLLSLIIFTFSTLLCWSQNISTTSNLFKIYDRASEININSDIKDAVFLEISNSELARINSEKSSSFKLEIPVLNNEKIIFDLHTVKVVSDNFSVVTGNNEKVAYTPGLYYQGPVEGVTPSLSALSFFENSVMGVFSFGGQNYSLGLWNDPSGVHQNIYILYKDSNVLHERELNCSTNDDESSEGIIKSSQPENPEQLFVNCIKVYFECDYKMYTDKGSNSTNVANFVTGMFNSIQCIYTVESIGMEISEIYIWSSIDPYVSDTTSSMLLTKFRNVRTTYNGNLAHLLSTKSGNLGGRAVLNGLCTTLANSYAISNIDANYYAYPSYSWTTYVVAHEIGHNLGSRHTHWCGWTGGPIDDCAPIEDGPCTAGPHPTAGGTIMSYCHLNNVGIFLTNGFGTQPGNLIRSKYNAANCLTSCTPPPSPPANDNCANAILINSSQSCSPVTGTTLNATSTGNDACTSPLVYGDVWYKFVALDTDHSVTVQGLGGLEAGLEIKESPNCSGNSIVCINSFDSTHIVSWDLDNLVVGATYIIRVYHIGNGSMGGNFTVCVTHTLSTPGPNNNNCGTPTTLTSSLTCNPTTGSTASATQSIPGTCTGTADDDVWFNFIAQSANHTVKVQGSAGFDAVVDIRSSTSCSGTNIVCSDASGSGGVESVNLTGLTAGTSYLVRVYHYGAGAGSGTFDICVTHSAPPSLPNDNCSSAISIPSSTTCTYVSGSTTGATQSITGSCVGTGDDDVWYSFTAVTAEHKVTVQGGAGFDPVIDIRTGTCNGTNVMCTDATGAAGEENATLTGLTIGATYFIRLYHFSAGAGDGSFQICVTHTVPAAPSNDICTSATALTSSATCNYLNGTTTGATQSIPGSCNGTGDDDVWYSFIAAASNHTVKVQSAAGFDAVIDIRTSPNCSGTNLVCSDNSGGAGLETVNLTGLTVGATYMIRVYHYIAGSGSGNFQICVTHTSQTCTYSISPTNLSYAATGGTGTIAVTSGNSCNWTATTSDSWVSITSGNSGTGNGSVNYSVATNSGSTQRTGTITIGGQTHTIAQTGSTTCTYTVSPLNQTYSAVASNGTISITTTNSCNWAAVSNASWVTITSGNSGTGNGTVTYSLTGNNTTSQRVATITVAGQVYTITQNGTIPCSYNISPNNMSYAASGGTGTINVTTASGCSWTSGTTDSWIVITSSSSGSGNGTVSYSVASNPGTTQRTGSITIGGQTHTIAQSGNTNCTFAISPLNQTFTSTTGNGTVTVTAANGCNWSVTSNDAWITVTSGSAGSGNGTVNYSVAANSTSSQRVGTITIAGQIHSITQSGVAPCSYTISPASLSFNAIGGPGSVNVNSANGCQWIATSNDSWITITSGSTGSGIATVNYSVLNNTTTTQRTGTLTIAGQTHTIVQQGLQCSYTLFPTAFSHPASADAGSFSVASTSGCNWTAATTDSWITINTGTGSGNGSIAYSVTANTSTTQRLGIIAVAGQTYTVVQNGTSSCSYSIAPANQTLTSASETGSFSVTTISGCTWAAISNNSWITITAGNNGSGNGTVNFTIQDNTSSSQRIGTITVGGQIHTLTQSGITCPATPVVASTGCSLVASLISNVSYQWYISGTLIPNETTQFYTANQPGFYSVSVTDTANGCVSNSEPEYVSCSGVGVTELNLTDAIVIYPNPSSGVFNIKSTGIFGEEKVKISIINVYGQLVYSTHITPQNGEVNITLDKLNPAKGTYNIRFNFSNTELNKKLIIK